MVGLSKKKGEACTDHMALEVLLRPYLWGEQGV